MSGTNQRTRQNDGVGHFMATVQLDSMADDRSIDRQRQLANVTGELIDLMDRHRLPVTWAVSDPAQSAATPHIRRSTVPHEFAILGDSNWLGPKAGRTRFARELARRVSQSRAAGLNVCTLVPRVASIKPDIDLVVKQQIAVVAGSHDSESSATSAVAARALHFGIWEIPFSGKLPARGGWLFSGSWSLWRAIRAASRRASTFHLLIDAPAVCDEGSAAGRTIAALMGRVASLRDREQLKVETLRQTAERLSDVPAVKPQRSILHRAA